MSCPVTARQGEVPGRGAAFWIADLTVFHVERPVPACAGPGTIAPMPLVHVHLARGRSAAQRAAILDGIHDALVQAFRIPAHDRNQVLHQHDPEDFQAHRGPGAVFVEITAFPGRSPTAKKALYAALVRNLAGAGVDPAVLLTVLHEPPLESWGIRGGLPASEVDLGFSTEV